MADKFKKLMREQVQESLNNLEEFTRRPIPKKGWIRTIRVALDLAGA